MKYYQPIGKQKNSKWTNFDTDYFVNFEKAKEYIRKKAKDKECIIYGLDVFDTIKSDYIGMFWQLEGNGHFSRNYKE